MKFRAKRLLSICLTFIMTLSFLSISPAVADDKGKLAFGVQASGEITGANSNDQFQVVLTEPGRLTVNTSSPVDGGLSQRNVEWLTQNGVFIKSDVHSGSAGTYVDLEAATYIIRISGAGTGSYFVTANFLPAKNTDKRPHNTLESAVLLTTESIKGFISNSSEVDYYKYTSKDPGKLTINITSPVEGGLGNCSVDWLDSKGVLLNGGNKTGSYSQSMDLEAGTYYISVGKSSSTGIYYIEAKFQSTAPSQYTITFNANGGTGAPANQTKTHNTALTLSTTKPTRTNYTFLGWATTSTATTAAYTAGGTYPAANNANATLYAVWQSGQYTISFNANGGSGAPANQTKVHDTALTLSNSKPTRTGYNFLGWSTSSTATTATYTAGGTYPANSNANATLYAVWQSNTQTTYTITYNANGGSGAPSSQTKTYNVALTLTSSQPTRSGYTFQGWSTSSTATTASYSAGGTYPANSNANVTLYAVWKSGSSSTCTISYNANGGSGGPSSQTKTYDVSLKLSTSEPTRSGYTFQGWSTSSSSSTVAYQPGDTYPAKNNTSVTLYAVWKSGSSNTSTISYDANGGSGAPSSQTKTNNSSIRLSTSEPNRSGYTFQGWSTSSSSSTATYQPGDTYPAKNNSNVTLYAVWKSGNQNSYTISYSANGGTGAPSSQTKSYDVSLRLSSSEPTRSGYTFAGWSTSSSATTAMYQPGGTYPARNNSDITLYAVWQTRSTSDYTVDVSANRSAYGSVFMSSSRNPLSSIIQTTINAQEGDRISLYATANSGFEFDYWQVEYGNVTINDSYAANASFTMTNRDVSVIAVFREKSSSGVGSNVTIFTIGSKYYTVNGVRETMDIAPYITDDRTFIPLRFVARATGVADQNILYNQPQKIVTMIKGERIVQVTIGSLNLLVNEDWTVMDTVPVLIDPPGRTMFPVRWIAEALGCKVDWDPITKEVRIY